MPGASWWVEGPAGVSSAGYLGDAVRVPVREPVGEGTPYDLASLTKVLATALLSVLLEEEGRIDLDTPARDLVDEFTRSPYHDATLLDLSTHRTGLPAWRPLYLHESTLDGYVRRIVREPPAAARGTTLYSDLGYIALGAALERAAGEPLDRLFASRVAFPLASMTLAFAPRGRSMEHAAATEIGNHHERLMVGSEGEGYSWRSGLIRGTVHDGNAWGLGGVAGHAGLFGSAAEVAGVAREMLWPERLRLGARARARLLTSVEGRGSRAVGFQLARDSESVRGVLPDGAVGHLGFTGTSIWLDGEHEKLYVLLTNRVHPSVPPEEFLPVRRDFHRLASIA